MALVSATGAIRAFRTGFMTASGPANHPDPTPNGPQSANDRIVAGQGAVPEPLQRLGDLIATSPHNLVAAGDRSEIISRHILECDALAAALAPTGRWMDLGTGGGLPGLVLAYRHPEVTWVLVDATAKKVAAVQGFASALSLTNVTAVHGRAETLAHERAYRGRFDGVVCRAVAQLATLAELARGFLRPGAELAAMKGPAWEAELARAHGALHHLHLQVSTTTRLPLPGRTSWVVRMRADGAPPPGFPRRDGIPQQQPLR